jgi:hypothetical protein
MAISDDFSRYLNVTTSSSSSSPSMVGDSADNSIFDDFELSMPVLPPPPKEVNKWFAEPFKFDIEEVQLVKDEEDSSEKVMFDPENLVL